MPAATSAQNVSNVQPPAGSQSTCDIPARMPLVPAALRPFFFMMKLEPMKMAELHARARPFA